MVGEKFFKCHHMICHPETIQGLPLTLLPLIKWAHGRRDRKTGKEAGGQAKRHEDRQRGWRTGKEAGGQAKRREDGQSGPRTGQDVGQGTGRQPKGRGAGNETDGTGQAPGLPGGVLGHEKRVAGRAFL